MGPISNENTIEKANVGKVMEPNHRLTVEKLIGLKRTVTIQTVEEMHE